VTVLRLVNLLGFKKASASVLDDAKESLKQSIGTTNDAEHDECEINVKELAKNAAQLSNYQVLKLFGYTSQMTGIHVIIGAFACLALQSSPFGAE
jgi:hypothetical protein